MPGRFDQTLDKLIKQQTNFIQGAAGTQVSNTPLQLSGQFSPTLDQVLSGGLRADTSAARGAATQASNLQLNNAVNAINERAASKGLTGSSAQSQQIATAGVDLATLLGDRLAQLELGADEAAAGRRVQGLDASIAQANAATQGRAVDVNQARFNQANLGQQATAGQDLINALLRNNINFGQGSAQAPGVPNPRPTPGVRSAAAPVSRSFATSVSPRNESLDFLQRAFSDFNNRPVGPGGSFGAFRSQPTFAQFLQTRPELVSTAGGLFGNNSLVQAGVGAGQNQSNNLRTFNAASPALAAGASANQGISLQQDFLNSLVNRFGSSALGMGGNAIR